MILVVWLVGCFSALIIVLVRFFVRTLLFMCFWYHSGICCIICCHRSWLLWSLDDCLELFSASRRTLRAYTTQSSVRTRCSSVRSLFPSHTLGFHLSANFGAGCPDPFPTSGRCARTVSPNSHQFSTVRSAHDTIEWALYLTTSETRNEPRCVSDNPSHQCVVCRWSVVCVFLHCCQLCSHLSLQLFLIVFDSSIALM